MSQAFTTSEEPVFETPYPVAHLILHQLSLIAPLKTLTLSKYYYKHTIPTLYHTVTVCHKLFHSLSQHSTVEAWLRTAEALSRTRILLIRSMESAVVSTHFNISSCPDPIAALEWPVKNLFSNVKRLEYDWEVVNSQFLNRYSVCYTSQNVDNTLIRLLPSSFQETVAHVLFDGRARYHYVLDELRRIAECRPQMTTVIFHTPSNNQVPLRSAIMQLPFIWPYSRIRIIISLINAPYDTKCPRWEDEDLMSLVCGVWKSAVALDNVVYKAKTSASIALGPVVNKMEIYMSQAEEAEALFARLYSESPEPPRFMSRIENVTWNDFAEEYIDFVELSEDVLGIYGLLE